MNSHSKKLLKKEKDWTAINVVGSLEELAMFASHIGKRLIAGKNELRRSLQ